MTDVDIDCFVYPGWQPRIRPATRRRAWMDASPEAFAYRCLPLAMANSHGWEIVNATGFSARWLGGGAAEDVEIRLDDPAASGSGAPVSLFGQATLTFHVEGLFRTPPGWNLWVGGPPNETRDGIAPLGGLIETDWSPYSFTMNWRFTRPDNWVRFAPGETICFFFPVERGVIGTATPRLRDIDEAPDLRRQFEAWSASRGAFHRQMRETPPSRPGDKWQKLYYRGVDADGVPAAAGHQTKLRAPAFADVAAAAPRPACPAGATAPRGMSDATRLARRDWMLTVQERLRALSPRFAPIRRYERIDADVFLDDHYAANVPAILVGEMAGWPTPERWTPDHLAALVGGGLRIGAEGVVVDEVVAGRDALAPLHAELGRIDTRLAAAPDGADGTLWIGAAGTIVPLECGAVNRLIAQIVGRRRVILVPPGESSKLDASGGLVSPVGDLLDPETPRRAPQLAGLRGIDLVLEPGEMLFVPVGWWHQITALEFGVAATYTGFRWPNAWDHDFPV